MPPNSPDFPNGGDRRNADATAQEDSSDLNDRQRAAIELLVVGVAAGAVARKLEIDRKTLFNWRKLERFNHELARRRSELWSAAGDRLRALVHPSLDVMESHLRDNYDRNRFRAASAILRISSISKTVVPSDEGGVT
jgi:hypothetical protein